MVTHDIWMLIAAAALVILAGLSSAIEAALASFSRARAEELQAQGLSGAQRLLAITEDPPRYLNTALFARMLCEITAIVLVAEVFLGTPEAVFENRWVGVAATVAIMLIVSFVFVGVGPRTVGRQHPQRIALLGARPLYLITRVLGPLPQLLIIVGNAITPGRGFTEGPFASEAELRELVDLAEASKVIESGEREMIHPSSSSATPWCAR